MCPWVTLYKAGIRRKFNTKYKYNLYIRNLHLMAFYAQKRSVTRFVCTGYSDAIKCDSPIL